MIYIFSLLSFGKLVKVQSTKLLSGGAYFKTWDNKCPTRKRVGVLLTTTPHFLSTTPYPHSSPPHTPSPPIPPITLPSITTSLLSHPSQFSFGNSSSTTQNLPSLTLHFHQKITFRFITHFTEIDSHIIPTPNYPIFKDIMFYFKT